MIRLIEFYIGRFYLTFHYDDECFRLIIYDKKEERTHEYIFKDGEVIALHTLLSEVVNEL